MAVVRPDWSVSVYPAFETSPGTFGVLGLLDPDV
jgi:hypothetical protein